MEIKILSRRSVTVAAPQAPVVVDLQSRDPGRAERVRKLAATTGKLAGVLTMVPFVPPPVRMGAGAVTGISTAVDVAFRPRGERAVAQAASSLTDQQVFSDPAAFAADVTSAITAGALAAGEAIIGVRTGRLLGRTARIVIATGVIAAGTAVGYRYVVRPALDRRARRREEEARSRSLVVFEEGTPAGVQIIEVVELPFEATTASSASSETEAAGLVVEVEGIDAPADAEAAADAATIPTGGGAPSADAPSA
jgi:hypothetical protein